MWCGVAGQMKKKQQCLLWNGGESIFLTYSHRHKMCVPTSCWEVLNEFFHALCVNVSDSAILFILSSTLNRWRLAFLIIQFNPLYNFFMQLGLSAVFCIFWTQKWLKYFSNFKCSVIRNFCRQEEWLNIQYTLLWMHKILLCMHCFVAVSVVCNI